MTDYKKLISDVLEEDFDMDIDQIQRWLSENGISIDDFIPLGQLFSLALPPELARTALTLTLTGFHLGFEVSKRAQKR